MTNEHTQEHDGQDSGEGRMYDLLCRYVFGEATEAERAEVESALASSDELRAQKAELDATVALVQGAYAGAEEVPAAAGGPTLSQDRMAELQAAAREASASEGDFEMKPAPRGPRPWYASQAVKFAAAATVLLGVGAIFVNGPDLAPGSADVSESVAEESPVAGEAAPRTETAVAQDLAALDREAPQRGETGVSLGVSVAAEEAAPAGRAKADRIENGLRALGYGAPAAKAQGTESRHGVESEARVSVVDELVDPSSSADDFFLGRGGGGGASGNSLAGLPGAPASGPSSPGPAAPAAPAIREVFEVPSTADIGAFFDDGESGMEFEGRVEDLYDRRGKELWSGARTRAAGLPLGRMPGERPRDMFFRFWGDNPFVVTRNDALSTFAADVDTASFTLARRMLRGGMLPQRDQIRTEEFVNFAKPDLAPPTEDTFAVYGELAPSPFGGREDRWLLRVGVRAKEVAREERPPLALTFVIDTSGSMRTDDRLELVKHSLRLLVNQLDGRDTLSIVGFSNEAREILPPTPASASDTIETALFGLVPDGGTNAEAGLKLGYAMSLGGSASPEAQKRVIFLSDGVANIGQTDQDRLANEISDYANQGVFLNTIGVGMSNHSDVFLEQLANKGQGVCDYVGDAADARRAIVDRFVSGFVTVAKDLKIQVEFDGAAVLRWRQLGYENRAVADRDFRNDAVDAGEVGAGHQVTCYYELELASNVDDTAAALAKVRLRWKPVGSASRESSDPEVRETMSAFRYGAIVAPSFRAATSGFRLGALSAQLAECLRQSYHSRGDSMDRLATGFANLLTDAPSEDVAGMAEAVKLARELGLTTPPPMRPADADAAQRRAYYEFLIESLGGAEPKDSASESAADSAADSASGSTQGAPKAPLTSEEYESRIRELLNGDQGKDPH